MKEEDLAKLVEIYYKNQGYDVYKEVSLYGGGSIRADLYCVKEGKSIAIETKMGLGLKVLDQAHCWSHYASSCIICLPYKPKTDYTFAMMLCRDYGIGVMFYKHNQLELRLEPMVNEDPIMPKLFEEQKESVAGNARGEFVTPYKITIAFIVEHLKSNGGSDTINNTVKNIKHHYANESSAKSSLSKWAKNGSIKEFGLKTIDKVKYFYLK